MPTLDVAHIIEQGLQFVIAPMHANFGLKTEEEQNSVIDELRFRATNAGLDGMVVPIWPAGGTRMGFRAPDACQLFLHSIDLGFVAQNNNKALQW